ncbi:MAG: hypothetical protein ACI309_06605, partial [Candidatus Limisoma sp.]
ETGNRKQETGNRKQETGNPSITYNHAVVVYYHDRASPKLASNVLIFTRLNLSEVEPGVYHNLTVSDGH